MRFAEIKRKTNETDINISINLDGVGNTSIQTGIGFLDHMLNNLGVHGLFDLDIMAKGDLHVDPHHTVEDCAIVLGKGINQALGDRKGITRIGSSYVPMDEALALVVIDLSGRPYSVIQVDWKEPDVGGIPTSLIPHFLESFAIHARCNLHAQVFYGKDNHHTAEALFKAFGRALDEASKIDLRRGENIPSTKGSL